MPFVDAHAVTFVIIGHNRQRAFQRVKADHDFFAWQQEMHGNTESMRVIERRVREIHEWVIVGVISSATPTTDHLPEAGEPSSMNPPSYSQTPSL